VDRVDFVRLEDRGSTAEDEALPIGYGQTISQPYTVAFMLELLWPRVGEKILDVGSGSGWTTALLAAIVGPKGKVCGVERVPELVGFGRANLAKYTLPQAEILQAGKELGLPEAAPFDRILVSAAAESSVPVRLVAQLKVGGILVMPVGEAIWCVEKLSGTQTRIEKHPGFVFVPLVGAKGEKG
jgi:protein-L-isoaspartate(D-aspartate) O-methyltransferase